MPTGYTYAIQSGEITTLRDFALGCARAFGPLIMMRDEPMDAPIPQQFEPDTSYHDEQITKAEERLEHLHNLTFEQAQAEADAAYETEARRRGKYLSELQEHRQRYEAMLAKVKNWAVPVELRELQDFMVEQITKSIDFDCSETQQGALYPEPGERWRQQNLSEALSNLDYYTEKRNEEIERTAGRNKWLKALFDSLPPETVN